jgi:LytS/YehU family sensor histidine kinase
VVAIIFIVVLYGRSASKQRSAALLQQRNNIILQQKSEIELMNKKLEMKVLLAQINPHLVFNSLNAIQYFVSLNDKKNATSYISNFSRYLRQILANVNSLTTTLEKEVKLLSQYLELEQLRFENKFDFSIYPLPAAADRLIEIPSMLIYPFVETALYQHVLIKKTGRGNIDIHFNKNADAILVTIADNGEGSEATQTFLAKRTGDEFNTTLKKAMAHIDLINYERENKITITQKEELTGSSVIIEIPLSSIHNEIPL